MVIKTFSTAKNKALIVYIDGLTDKNLIDRDIIFPLKAESFDGAIAMSIKAVSREVNNLSECIKSVLKGDVAVFYDMSDVAWIVEFKGWRQRAIDEPTAESTIRGPKEGLTESIRTNTAMVRRKIKTPDLTIEGLTLGKQTNTDIAIVYITGIVNQEVLKELKKRLSKIDTDSILETGYIEQYIEENTFSPISGIGLTQKPDIIATKILEGRVAVLCDGTPHALIIPELFIENIQSAEDYYNRAIFSSIIRMFRFLGLFITVMLPGLFVAATTFDQEMVPAELLTSIISSTQKTPMPVSAEILLLTVMFELLKEAGTRLPRAIGSAITIVGSLIIGEAAVNAGIVSATSVIIVAVSAVTSFIVSNLYEFALIYRFLFWLLGSIMGIIGIGAGYVIMMTQLISTTSFGVPVLSSFSKSELKDSVVRFPLKLLRYRPFAIAKDNIKRKNIK